MKKFIQLIIIMGLATAIKSQNLQTYPLELFNSVGTDERINCIYQDKLGFLWIGKETGLVRYDGNETRVYLCDTSGPANNGNNNVLVITENGADNLLIGTKTGGLNSFHRPTGTFTRYLHQQNNPATISDNEVKSICPDGKGNFWVGTESGGLNFFNAKTGKFISYKAGQKNARGLKSNTILQIVTAGKDLYWVSTWAGGLHLFNSVTGEFQNLANGTPFENLNVYCVKEVKPGVLWLAAYDDGILSYNISQKQFSTVVSGKELPFVKSIDITKRGEIFVASRKGLVYFRNADAAYTLIKGEGFDYTSVTKLFVDIFQSVWSISGTKVIGRTYSLLNQFHITGVSSTGNEFSDAKSPIYQKQTNVLYYISNNHLIIHNLTQGPLGRFPIPFPNAYWLLDVPEMDALLCSGVRGMIMFDKTKKQFFPFTVAGKRYTDFFKHDFRVIFKDISTGFWTMGHSSLYHLAPDGKTWKVAAEIHSSQSPALSWYRYPNCLIQLPGNDIWMGTWGNGLLKKQTTELTFNSLKGKYTPQNNDLSNDFIECMVADQKGNILIGTQAGLNRFNPKTFAITKLTIADGLQDDWISNIVIDQKNRIWASTRLGISMISDDFKTIRNFDISDGLPNKKISPRASFTDKDGKIYFGSAKGLVWFFPDSIKDMVGTPNPAIVGFKIDEKTVPVSANSPLKQNIEFTREIRLNHRQSSFSFQLAALGYFGSKRNLIKYKLEGFDRGWIMAGPEQIAQYTNVPPGKYTFVVYAANNMGVWNPKCVSVTMVITPPFWSSWGIILPAVILIFAGIFLYLKLYRSAASVSGPLVNEPQNLHPPKEGNEGIKPADAQFLKKVIEVVEEEMANPDFGVEALRDKMCLSQRQLYRRINSITGLTVPEFIKEARLKKAATLLLQNKGNVSEVAFMVGFSDTKYFSKCFKQQFGVTPAQFSAKNV